MIRAFTTEQVRDAEKPLLEAGEPLMQRAATALALRTLRLLRQDGAPLPGARVLVLAGPGNNGGDGLFAAARLRRRGVAADALAVLGRHHEDGARALRTAGGRVHVAGSGGTGERDREEDPTSLFSRLTASHGVDLVLDAVTGTGGRPELAPAVRSLFDAVREAGAPVLAVDVPSGTDATTGIAAEGALNARETVTFGAITSGLLLPGCADLAGTVHLADIGLAPQLPDVPDLLRLDDGSAAELWPRPSRDADKYSRGVVEITAGSATYPGAAVLSTSGAARAGAGMVRLDAPQRVVDLVLQRRPEVVGDRGKHQSRVVGSGVPAEDERLADALEDLAHGTRPHEETRLPGVVDAGGLEAIGPGDRFHEGVVLTPHAGEASRLAEKLGVDASQPAPRLARALAEATGATVLLKGAVTIIAPPDPDQPLLSQDDATAQLATAGAGDVLGGVLGSLLAAGLPGPRAAALAALVHGRAARAAARGGLAPIAALDVAEHVPAVVTTILAGAARRHPSDEAGGA
ncbi:NAD(P)H-hydrate epimerase [Brachybacterium endophyticum]|uniref:Bifunctional NAD(P)H-hydrate repair enzyme n=1 Tax=Brachybacterium endophyticum TaxID=2182385 RepID=A0A2U2RPP6_9MICO|nr:NAD(P)H-hydrate epimerase [Brachybacterium endophyticum]PWH07842.1 NAD(P)H-hydrate epimerase [Brachybacterium endophyticum]